MHAPKITKLELGANTFNDKLEQLIKNNSEIMTFNLSEIIFLEKNKIAIENKYKEIVSSIKTVGFKDAAVIHSISESSKINQYPKSRFRICFLKIFHE